MGWKVGWSLVAYDWLFRVNEKNGVLLNPEKLQLPQKEIDFSGFTVTIFEIKPQEKFKSEIRDFPIPKSLTDVRSWFGLMH